MTTPAGAVKRRPHKCALGATRSTACSPPSLRSAPTIAAAAVIGRRCASCHAEKEKLLPRALADERGVFFWRPDWNDPRLLTSRHILFNLSRPEKSLMLLAPLAESAGAGASAATRSPSKRRTSSATPRTPTAKLSSPKSEVSKWLEVGRPWRRRPWYRDPTPLVQAACLQVSRIGKMELSARAPSRCPCPRRHRVRRCRDGNSGLP